MANLHYICQQCKAKKTIIMNEQTIQHTNSPAQDADVFSQQDLSTPGTQRRQGSMSPGDAHAWAEPDMNSHFLAW